jgi:molybdopterin-guanine dinucleotide biosynthesis protein A
VFVLPGDLACITENTVRALVGAASSASRAACVVARTDRLEPCVGVYRPAATPTLRARVAQHSFSLHDAFEGSQRVVVPLQAADLRNVNRPEDLV